MLTEPTKEEWSKLKLLDKDTAQDFQKVLTSFMGNPKLQRYLQRLAPEIAAYQQSLGTDPESLLKAIKALLERHFYYRSIIMEHRRKLRQEIF